MIGQCHRQETGASSFPLKAIFFFVSVVPVTSDLPCAWRWSYRRLPPSSSHVQLKSSPDSIISTRYASKVSDTLSELSGGSIISESYEIGNNNENEVRQEVLPAREAESIELTGNFTADAESNEEVKFETVQEGKKIDDVTDASVSSDSNKKESLPPRRRLFGKKKAVCTNSTAFVYSKKLKNRNHVNLRRKFTHTAFGFLFASLNHRVAREKFLPGMTLLTSATLLMELLRYRKYFGWMNDALHFVLGSALRKQEMEGKFTGSFYYFFGVTSTSFLFGKNAATIGIIQLALADPAASYFGRQTRDIYWSRIERGFFGLGRNKGILGFLGGALFCLPFNYRMLSIADWGADGIPGGVSNLFLASLGLGAAGALADLFVPTPAITMPRKICGIPVPPFHVDDNFVVPICSGYACTQIFKCLGWSQNLQLSKYLLM